MRGLTLSTKEQNRLSIMNAVLERRLAVNEAAQLIGVSERHTWRLLAAYRKEGASALAHGNRGRLPANTISPVIKEEVISLAEARYQGVNHTHLTELLEEREGFVLSRSTVRRLMALRGLSSPWRRRRPRHRYRRQRMPQEGMLIQIDGSHHRWLEERGPRFALLLSVDDATGKVPYAFFQEKENTEGYFRLLLGIVQRYGIPLALYSDRHLAFRRSRAPYGSVDGFLVDSGKPTQFGRAIRELGITHIFARSPEAKGRVERVAGTFQDRLVTELRLAGASTIDEANAVLEDFIPRFNKRFGVPATRLESAYRPVDPGVDIGGVFCFKEKRRVAKDNTVQYYEHTLQLFPDADRPSYARARVEVQQRLDGQLVVCYKGKVLTPGEAPPLAATLRTLAAEGSPSSQMEIEMDDLIDERPKANKRQTGLGWDGDWYHDDEKKCIHGQLVRAGMEQARQQGKRIGRPSVTERDGFPQQLRAVVNLLNQGQISRRQAARKLSIGYATLKRLLDARSWSSNGSDQETIAAGSTCSSKGVYDDILVLLT
jgi:transposase